MDVVSSWDRFKDTLERLPMKRELNLLETMKLDIFPQQEETFPVRFPNLEREIEHPSLVGEEITVDADEGDTGALAPGTEVCVYNATAVITDPRPWIAVVSQQKSKKKVKVHWYKHGGGKGRFSAMYDGRGKPVESEIDTESIMFWSMAESIESEQMILSGYWLKRIAHEYDVLDEAFK